MPYGTGMYAYELPLKLMTCGPEKVKAFFFVLHKRGCDLESCESTHDFVQLQLNKRIISLLLEALELALLSFFYITSAP